MKSVLILLCLSLFLQGCNLKSSREQAAKRRALQAKEQGGKKRKRKQPPPAPPGGPPPAAKKLAAFEADFHFSEERTPLTFWGPFKSSIPGDPPTGEDLKESKLVLSWVALHVPALRPMPPIGPDDDADLVKKLALNDLGGKWFLTQLDTGRTDEPIQFLQNLLLNKDTLILELPYKPKDSYEVTFPGTLEFERKLGKSGAPCKLVIALTATYCCPEMRKLTIKGDSSISPKESQAGCIQDNFNFSPEEFSKKLIRY